MISLLIAGGVSLALSLVGSSLLITWLVRHGVGQPIRVDGPKQHLAKAGTPTMGGIAIVFAAAVGYGVAHLRHGLYFTRSGLFVMGLVIFAGAVGFLDDWIKIRNERNLGLNKRAKIVGLLVVAAAFSVATVKLTAVHTELSFTRYDNFHFNLGTVGWCAWAVLLIVASTNAVNLTDGLDGLAAGSSLFGFAAFVVVGFWAFRHPGTYAVPHALDLAVVAAAMVGGCAGFLWWNAAPAQIFMGDTGALAIGAAFAGLALTTDTQLLLPVVGGLFVIETLSVIVQIASFRLFGRRVFRMAPIHHHFEVGGWPETTVIVRFWLLAGLCTAVALGIFYADFLGTGAID